MEGNCHCGAVQWRFAGKPASATACNCTVCRRYGALWAYDYLGEGISVSGTTTAYQRRDEFGGDLAFHFCPTCGCACYWLGREAGDDHRRRIAVNLRLAEPGLVADVPIQRFEGLESFEDLPVDGRCVADYWF